MEREARTRAVAYGLVELQRHLVAVVCVDRRLQIARAGETTAILYSRIASTERHELDPQRYLTGLFARLPFTPAEELDQFMPDVWKQAAAPLGIKMRENLKSPYRV